MMAVFETLTAFYRKREEDDRHANCFILNISFDNGEKVAFTSTEVPPAHPLAEVGDVSACGKFSSNIFHWALLKNFD
jgi:hypothetical protein